MCLDAKKKITPCCCLKEVLCDVVEDFLHFFSMLENYSFLLRSSVLRFQCRLYTNKQKVSGRLEILFKKIRN